MAGLLHGKIALITGASAGIGRAAALTMAREGAKVLVADMVEDKGNETVKLIKDAGGEAAFTKCDVSRASEAEALVAAAVTTFGRLDCAFNNAGIGGQIARTADYIEEEFDRIIAVNLRGVWLWHEVRDPPDDQAGKWRRDRQYGVRGRAGRFAWNAGLYGVETRRGRID